MRIILMEVLSVGAPLRDILMMMPLSSTFVHTHIMCRSNLGRYATYILQVKENVDLMYLKQTLRFDNQPLNTQ